MNTLEEVSTALQQAGPALFEADSTARDRFEFAVAGSRFRGLALAAPARADTGKLPLVLATQQTDNNGRYQFTGLFAGLYSVTVTPPSGYTPTYDLDGLLTPNTATRIATMARRPAASPSLRSRPRDSMNARARIPPTSAIIGTARSEMDSAAYRRKHGMEPALGELGCYLSHVAVMRALLASAHRFALVLEDDVLLTPALYFLPQATLAATIVGDIQGRTDLAQLPRPVFDFLCGPWAQVVAQARIKQGAGSASAEKFEALIPALLWSAHPTLARANPAKLTRLVPRLLATLREGLETIHFPGTRSGE